MTMKSGIHAVAPMLAAIALACGGSSTLNARGEAVASTVSSAGRAELTVSSTDYDKLLTLPTAGGMGPGCAGGPGGGMGPGGPGGGRGPGGPGRMGPPQEAVQACSSLAAGAACSFSHDGHSLSGTCRTGPDGTGAVACAPAGGPGGPGGPGTSAQLSLDGQSAVSAEVSLLPAPRDAVASAQTLFVIHVHQDGATPSDYLLIPEPPAASATAKAGPAPVIPADAPRFALAVDHGGGWVDFGTYVQVTPPARQ